MTTTQQTETAQRARYEVETDGLTFRPRFSRRYAVVDTQRFGRDGKPSAVLETDDPARARSYAYELNLTTHQTETAQRLPDPDDLCVACRIIDEGGCQARSPDGKHQWCPKGHHLRTDEEGAS